MVSRCSHGSERGPGAALDRGRVVAGEETVGAGGGGVAAVVGLGPHGCVVVDADARALLAQCVATLTAADYDPNVSDVDRAHAAAWLHRGLWTHPRSNPRMADLLALVSPVLPWPK